MYPLLPGVSISMPDQRHTPTMDLADRLIFRRDVVDLVADSTALSRAVHRGQLVRIKRGAYVPAEIWSGLSSADRLLATVLAFARSHPGVVFSHRSAAVLLGLPLIGTVPSHVEVLEQRASGGRSEPGLRRRCLGYELHEVQELAVGSLAVRCTTVVRTLADLATVQPFAYALAPLDFALRTALTSSAELADAIDRRGAFAGFRRVGRTVAFGDARSGSAGESLSRGVIHELGFLAPDLQVEHHNPDGGRFFTDFEWVDLGQIGEFDGKDKYLKDDYTGGRPAGDLVYDEKRREDFLRGEKKGMTRWGWTEAYSRVPLGRLLRTAGIPIVRPPVGLNRTRRDLAPPRQRS